MADIVEILQNKEAYEAPIDYITIDGTKFTNYGAFTFMWEKSYVDDESLKRANDGSIPQINDASFFITSHLKIDFSLLSIDDYRKLLELEYEQNEHLVVVYDVLRGQKWITQYMYIATLEMPKLWTIVENRQKGEENWEHWLSVCGVKDYTIELIGTNNPCNLPATYRLYMYWKNVQLYQDTYTTFTYRSFKELYKKVECLINSGSDDLLSTYFPTNNGNISYSLYNFSTNDDVNYIAKIKYINEEEDDYDNAPIKDESFDELSVNPSVLSEDSSGNPTAYNLAIVEPQLGDVDSLTNITSLNLTLYALIGEQVNIPILFYNKSGSVSASGIASFPTNTWVALGANKYAEEIIDLIGIDTFEGYFSTKDGDIELSASTEGYDDYVMLVLYKETNGAYKLLFYKGLENNSRRPNYIGSVDYTKGVAVPLYAKQTEYTVSVSVVSYYLNNSGSMSVNGTGFYVVSGVPLVLGENSEIKSGINSVNGSYVVYCSSDTTASPPTVGYNLSLSLEAQVYFQYNESNGSVYLYNYTTKELLYVWGSGLSATIYIKDAGL